MAETTRHPEYEHALPGYGAYKLADVKDAKRRRPGVTLEPYARARGLEFLDTLTPNGYQGVVPGDSRLQFNVLRGALAGGRPGILFHHVLAVPHDGDASGTGLTVSVFAPKVGARDLLSFVPWLGDVFDAAIPPKDKRPDAVGVPTTEAAALVPEAATVAPFRIGAGRGLTELSGRKVDPGFVERLLATPFGAVLREHGNRPYFRLGVGYGQLSIRVDGYLDRDDELDALVQAVSAAAEGLAQTCAPLHAPGDFADPLPDPGWPRQPRDALNREAPIPPTSWLPRLRAYANQHGSTPEDAFAYHRAFPRLPVPGVAFAVLRFTAPGTATPARLAWHNERSILTHNVGCNALLLPAAAGAPATERTRIPELRLQYAVRDGIFAVWEQRRWQTQEEALGDVDGLLETGLRVARETGLAAA